MPFTYASERCTKLVFLSVRGEPNVRNITRREIRRGSILKFTTGNNSVCKLISIEVIKRQTWLISAGSDTSDMNVSAVNG